MSRPLHNTQATEPTRPRNSKGVSHNQLPEGRLWALAAGGILTARCQDGFDGIASRSSKQAVQICLRDWWGVNNVDDLRARKDWLLHEGHHEQCRALVDKIEQVVLTTESGEELDLSPVESFVLNHLHILKKSSPLCAWDLCRLVQVSRWGYSAGYISEETAWLWIMEAARELRQRYYSWKEIGDDFILGYRFWNVGQIPDPSIFQCHDWLNSSTDSPWRRISWSIELDELR